MNEDIKQYEIISDGELIKKKKKLMDEFDEAFKELAK